MFKTNEWPVLEKPKVTDISSEAENENEPVSEEVLTKNLEDLTDSYNLLKADVPEVERKELRERILVAINNLAELTCKPRNEIYKDFLQRGFSIPSPRVLYPRDDI